MKYAIVAIALLLTPAYARWKPEYAANSPETRNWYETRELTAAAQQRFYFKSCCAHSDVVKTKFKVSRTSGKDEWFWLDSDNNWQQVPDDVIHWDEHAPNGDAVMFAIGTHPTCFYPPESGN